METRIIKIDPKNIDMFQIKIAGNLLKHGGLVAFPTETVYGLGANALDVDAVKRIFKAKGRPKDNPLIVHIADKKEVYNLAAEVPKEAEILMDKFWPGPLTLILKKAQTVPDLITAGLDAVAIRMPANEIALALIRAATVPIAAPSANLSGKPSPTSASHVKHDLYGKIDVIIDGGKTEIGIESTVLDLTAKPATVLRSGGISLEELESVLGNIDVHKIKKGQESETAAKSPGMKYKHYAPNAHVILVEGKYQKTKEKIQELVKKSKQEGKSVWVMTTNRNHNYKADKVKFMGNLSKNIAKNLFTILRECDKADCDVIITEGVEDKGLGLAIMNRLRKAANMIYKV